MMKSSPHWTKRAATRLRNAVKYIAVNFYPEYAIAFRNDAIETANDIPANPQMGEEAFPLMKRPNIRKTLCRNKKWWVFYKITKERIYIISVKHVLQKADTLSDL